MKKRAVKAAVLAIEVIAIAIAVFAASIAFLYWRLEQGPVNLSLFKPSAEFAIQRQWPTGYRASIGAVELRRVSDRGRYQFRILDVVVFDRQEVEAASAPEVLIFYDLGDVLGGSAAPREVSLDGANIRIVRQSNLNIEIPIARQRSSKSRKRRLAALLDGGTAKRAFQSVIISNAEIEFLDVNSGRSWSAPGSEIRLASDADGVTAETRGEINMDGTRAAFRATAGFSRESQIATVSADGVNFPVGDLLATFYGEDAAIVEASVSGRATIAFSLEGDVLSSEFDARLGKGRISFGGVEQQLDHASLKTKFDPLTNSFSIEQLEYEFESARGAISGEIAVSFGDDIRRPESISFNLASDETVLTVQPGLPKDLPISGVELSGRYHVSERRLAVEALQAQFAGLTALGDFSLILQRGEAPTVRVSPGVIANLDFEGSLNPDTLMSIWPVSVANGARDWVEDRVLEADIDNLKFRMDLPPGAVLENGALPDEAMTLTFNAKKTKAVYVPGMTPLRDGAGSGILRGNSFSLNVSSARVGKVAISTGEVSFPEFMPKWRPTYYRFTAVGKAEEMLSILDQAPLSLLSKVDLQPEQFSGDARAVVEIMRPNKREVAPQEYGYEGRATFENLKIGGLLGEIEIGNATGAVDLKTRSLKVQADASLAEEAPIRMIWSQNFYEEDGPSDLTLTGVFNSSTGDIFGLATRQFLRGPVAFEAKAVGDLGAFESLMVAADFEDATLIASSLDWRKDSGSPATGEVSMTFDPQGVRVSSLSLTGENLDVRGDLAFAEDGALRSANFAKFYLENAADLAIKADRDAAGVLTTTVVGPFLNAGPALAQLLEGQGASDQDSGFNWGAGLGVQARIDQIAMRNGIEYQDGALDLRRDAERLQSLDFSALGADGRPVTVSMAMTGASDGPQRAIEARTSAIGELMAAVFGVDSVAGGEGSMRVSLHQAGEPGFEGAFEARNLHVMNAPLLARIFSAGSLDGLANLMNGEGIEFNYAYGLFDYANGVVTVSDMRATGSSVGITADGYVDIRAGGESDLSGAVAPVYALNSVLGNAPIIGDILVGKKGEGILAFTYRVNGDTKEPTVFVNPLSALTPGIFRQLMQPERSVAPESTPTQSPNEATSLDEPAEETPAQ